MSRKESGVHHQVCLLCVAEGHLNTSLWTKVKGNLIHSYTKIFIHLILA